eukprot:5708800-Prymnesium_polylepis.1
METVEARTVAQRLRVVKSVGRGRGSLVEWLLLTSEANGCGCLVALHGTAFSLTYGADHASRCHDWSGPRCEAFPSVACSRKKRRLYGGAMYRTLHVQIALYSHQEQQTKCDLARGHVTWHDAKRFT